MDEPVNPSNAYTTSDSFIQEESKYNRKLREYEKSMDISEQRIQELELELQQSLAEMESLTLSLAEIKGREKNLKSHSEMVISCIL